VVVAVASLSIWYLLRGEPLLVQGEVDATRLDIAARVDGRVAEIPVERGQNIDASAVLVKIDNPETVAKNEQALAETRKMLDGKNDRETYMNLAQIYEKARNFTEMAKMLDSAEKLSNDNDEKEAVFFLRGAMYERMKNLTAAEAEFRKVLAINPDNAGALNYLGYMLADRNVRLEEARDLIQKALDREPNSGAYLDSMGWVYFRLNKLKEAEDKLLQALQSMSRDATVHDHLADVYFREGKTREAIAQWQSSLKEWQTSAPGDMDHAEVAKVQKKLEDAKIRLARESGTTKQP